MSTRAAVALQQPVQATRQQEAVSRLCGPAPHHRPCGWQGAAPWPQQCRQQAASQSSSRQPQRGAAPCSSSNGPPQLAFEAGGGGGGGSHASGGGGLDSGTRTLSDVIAWTINLPWQKAFSWVVVAVVGSQLRDFFGVRPPPPPAWHDPAGPCGSGPAGHWVWPVTCCTSGCGHHLHSRICAPALAGLSAAGRQPTPPGPCVLQATCPPAAALLCYLGSNWL